MGILSRPGDKPSPDEEAALEVMRLREVAKLDEIDGRLLKSSTRTVKYKSDLDSAYPGGVTASRARANLFTERRVQDRILDERRAVMGLVGRHG